MGRILNRLTYDVEILDISLSTSMAILMISVGWFVTGVVLQITILPWNVLALLPLVVLYEYWFLLFFNRKSAVDLQRLDAVSIRMSHQIMITNSGGAHAKMHIS